MESGKNLIFLTKKLLFSYKYLCLYKTLGDYLERIHTEIEGSPNSLSARLLSHLIFPIYKYPTVYIYFSSVNGEIICIHN